MRKRWARGWLEEKEIFPSNWNLTFADRLTLCRQIRNAVFSVCWWTVFQKSSGLNPHWLLPLPPTPSFSVSTYNLGQNKMEQQTPILPRQIKNEAARRAKTQTRYFPIFDLGGRGGSRFFIYFVPDWRFSFRTEQKHTVKNCQLRKLKKLMQCLS